MNANTSEFEELEVIAKAIGFIVINWGQAEQSLDLLVAILWNSFNGKNYAKKIPIMLEPKLKFVTACFGSELSLSSEKEGAKTLVEKFEKLGSLRHEIIHGAIASTFLNNQSIVLNKLSVKNGLHHSHEVKIEIESYPKLAEQLIELVSLSIELAEKVELLSE